MHCGRSRSRTRAGPCLCLELCSAGGGLHCPNTWKWLALSTCPTASPVALQPTCSMVGPQHWAVDGASAIHPRLVRLQPATPYCSTFCCGWCLLHSTEQCGVPETGTTGNLYCPVEPPAQCSRQVWRARSRRKKSGTVPTILVWLFFVAVSFPAEVRVINGIVFSRMWSARVAAATLFCGGWRLVKHPHLPMCRQAASARLIAPTQMR